MSLQFLLAKNLLFWGSILVSLFGIYLLFSAF